jgi:phosphate transport system ATP-binding protein
MTPTNPSRTQRLAERDASATVRAPLSVAAPPASRPASTPRDLQAIGRSISVDRLNAFYDANHAVRDVSIDCAANRVTAMIGPSGCGKSTLLRCLNRMHEEICGARVSGTVRLDDVDVYGEHVDVVSVRRAIGMVFQKANPFPRMSIAENVSAGLRLNAIKGVDLDERVERSLRQAGLWDEVKDRLAAPGIGLSGGQQQRLCIARTIAVEPDVILMDEPCSALDPIATLKVEELIAQLKQRFTIVIVTHNMQQAARVSDTTAFFYLGELVEHAPTDKLFSRPENPRTEQYVTGKFS